MRKINEKDFISYTIEAGWTLTVFDLAGALGHWKSIKAGRLYGNKSNGDRAILDTKLPE